MPILTPGMTVLGPAGGSSISTLPAYLASIGKNSWYARFAVGTNMYVNSDKTGGAVDLNGTVGSWDYDSSQSSGWTAYWTQSSASNRPVYSTVAGVNSVSGNSVVNQYFVLSSTTALNGPYTVIIKYTLLARDTRPIYSHNNTSCVIQSSSGGGQLFVLTSNSSPAADQIVSAVRNSPGTTSGNGVVGMVQAGTGHNGAAPYLFRRATAYSGSSVSEVWFTPELTASEMNSAMTFIT